MKKPARKAGRAGARPLAVVLDEPVVAEVRTQTQLRIDPKLKAAAIAAAEARGVSLNTFFNKALEDFLGRLRPAEELKWTLD